MRCDTREKGCEEFWSDERLQPYQMVKDLRSEHETGNVEGVLDGALDDFIEAYLRWQRAGSISA